MDFKAIAAKYENELLDSVIPFWEKNCVDNQFGGFFTMLDQDGSVYDTEKYMWMQWRIVYMFATFAEAALGTAEQKESWLNIAKKGFDFLVKNGKSPDGSYYFALNQEGVPSVAPYNIFSDCFAAMGAAALFKATGDELYKQEAESATRSYIKRMDNPKGFWEKSLSGRQKRLNLGHFMILANLGTVMKECLGTNDFDEETEKAVHSVMDKFWNDEFKIVFENINLDGTFDLNSCDGRHIIPGHGLESMWFILNYAESNGKKELIAPACQAIKGLLEFGWDKEHGGLYYFMDVLDKPHIELQADMKLWWVHNEAIIATLFAYKLSGDEQFLEWFKKLDEWTWNHFPDKQHGEWFGYLHRTGDVSHSLKGGKWKTFFHLPRFLFISRNILNEL
jgi:N-acylglucosamine 2-epimerase